MAYDFVNKEDRSIVNVNDFFRFDVVSIVDDWIFRNLVVNLGFLRLLFNEKQLLRFNDWVVKINARYCIYLPTLFIMNWFEHWFLLSIIIGIFAFVSSCQLTVTFVMWINIRRNPFQTAPLFFRMLGWLWLFLWVDFWSFVLVFLFLWSRLFQCRSSFSRKFLVRYQFDKSSFIISWKCSFLLFNIYFFLFIILLLVLCLVKAIHLLFLTWTFWIF